MKTQKIQNLKTLHKKSTKWFNEKKKLSQKNMQKKYLISFINQLRMRWYIILTYSYRRMEKQHVNPSIITIKKKHWTVSSYKLCKKYHLFFNLLTLSTKHQHQQQKKKINKKSWMQNIKKNKVHLISYVICNRRVVCISWQI